ncbi:MAG: DNA polymerase III subunit alpha, partial [Tepidisphaeraceae bacterium]
GLRTLTTLQRSIDLVKQIKGIEIDIEKIDFTDRAVLDLFCRGQTKGVFQFESGGMTDLLMKMHPDRLEDLIAANALYRPGPMELIPLYCNRKLGKETVPRVHPIMDEILAETYGIMVYQEQVMRIFNQLGGIELSAAYKLIKAISKKQSDVIARYKPDFLQGARSNGISRDQAEELFDLILKFGGYGFNKSHSTRYAILAFQTAYMKTYHPVEYMAALLTFEMGSTEKVVEYIEECRARGITVQAPDINSSDKDFTPIYVKKTGVIRFGLMAVRGVGEKAVEAIIEQRKDKGPFASLYDFCERVDQRQVTRGTMEALVKCGAFSSLKARRAQLLAILDRAVEMGQQSQQDKRMGQLSMFAAAGGTSRPADVLPNLEEFPSAELLKFEKELLGFYITDHPLTQHQAALANYATATTREAKNLSEGSEVTIGGMINKVKRAITKNGRSAGQPMAILTLEDLDGQIEATIFAESLAEISKRHPKAIAAEEIVFLRGKVDKRRETPGVIVNDLIPISDSMSRLTRWVKVEIDRVEGAAEVLRQLKPVLTKHKGNCQTFLSVPANGSRRALINLDTAWSVRPTPAMKEELEFTLNGQGRVELAGEGSRRSRVQQQPLFENADAPAIDAEPAIPAAFSDEEMG